MLKFYLDFEATQYTNQIISIGCECETGCSFTSLVKPAKGKINSFITELTGITEEMLEIAPTAEEVFINFFAWVQSQCRDMADPMPVFYSYGDDSKFIDATVKHMTNFTSIMYASAIKGRMEDYSQIINSKFGKHAISLRTLVAIILASDDIKQRHNALEDAEWLRLVDNNLDILSKEIVISEIYNKPVVKKGPAVTDIRSTGPFPIPQFSDLKFEPAHINKMMSGQAHMWENVADGTLGNKDDWKVRVWNDNNGGHEAFFRSIEDAVYWTFKVRTASMKSANNCRKAWTQICKCAENGTKFCHVFWEIKQEEKE